jgi:hypothetical protein
MAVPQLPIARERRSSADEGGIEGRSGERAGRGALWREGRPRRRVPTGRRRETSRASRDTPGFGARRRCRSSFFTPLLGWTTLGAPIGPAARALVRGHLRFGSSRRKAYNLPEAIARALTRLPRSETIPVAARRGAEAPRTIPMSLNTPAARRDQSFHLHPATNLRTVQKEGPLVITRGEGVYVHDDEGRRYIEGMARTMVRVARLFRTPARRRGPSADVRAAVLSQLRGEGACDQHRARRAAGRFGACRHGGGRCSANSGSEANDTAIKRRGTSTMRSAGRGRRRSFAPARTMA